jgi:anti-anti-sigma regulatory factor
VHAHPCGTHIVMVYNMTIRIDVNSEGPEAVVYLAGRLSGDAAEQLGDTCDSINGTFVLDLSKLLFSDDAGIDVIRAINEQGTRIRGASKFIQLLINDALRQKVDDEKI